jgi:hypothetical protein
MGLSHEEAVKLGLEDAPAPTPKSAPLAHADAVNLGLEDGPAPTPHEQPEMSLPETAMHLAPAGAALGLADKEGAKFQAGWEALRTLPDLVTGKTPWADYRKDVEGTEKQALFENRALEQKAHHDHPYAGAAIEFAGGMANPISWVPGINAGGAPGQMVKGVLQAGGQQTLREAAKSALLNGAISLGTSTAASDKSGVGAIADGAKAAVPGALIGGLSHKAPVKTGLMLGLLGLIGEHTGTMSPEDAAQMEVGGVGQAVPAAAMEGWNKLGSIPRKVIDGAKHQISDAFVKDDFGKAKAMDRLRTSNAAKLPVVEDKFAALKDRLVGKTAKALQSADESRASAETRLQAEEAARVAAIAKEEEAKKASVVKKAEAGIQQAGVMREEDKNLLRKVLLKKGQGKKAEQDAALLAENAKKQSDYERESQAYPAKLQEHEKAAQDQATLQKVLVTVAKAKAKALASPQDAQAQQDYASVLASAQGMMGKHAQDLYGTFGTLERSGIGATDKTKDIIQTHLADDIRARGEEMAAPFAEGKKSALENYFLPKAQEAAAQGQASRQPKPFDLNAAVEGAMPPEKFDFSKHLTPEEQQAIADKAGVPLDVLTKTLEKPVKPTAPQLAKVRSKVPKEELLKTLTPDEVDKTARGLNKGYLLEHDDFAHELGLPPAESEVFVDPAKAAQEQRSTEDTNAGGRRKNQHLDEQGNPIPKREVVKDLPPASPESLKNLEFILNKARPDNRGHEDFEAARKSVKDSVFQQLLEVAQEHERAKEAITTSSHRENAGYDQRLAKAREKYADPTKQAGTPRPMNDRVNELIDGAQVPKDVAAHAIKGAFNKYALTMAGGAAAGGSALGGSGTGLAAGALVSGVSALQAATAHAFKKPEVRARILIPIAKALSVDPKLRAKYGAVVGTALAQNTEETFKKMLDALQADPEVQKLFK